METISYWEDLNQPAIEDMLGEIAWNNTDAAIKAAQVWHRLTDETDQKRWQEQLAVAVASYRSRYGTSRIDDISTDILRNLDEPFTNCVRCGQLIRPLERREAYSQEPGDARRIHSRCAYELLCETFTAFRDVPEAKH